LAGLGIGGNVNDSFQITYDHRGFLPVSWSVVPVGTKGAVAFWELLQIISDTPQE
jgi:hypothetical protein